MDVHIILDFFNFVNIYLLLADSSCATALVNVTFVLLLEFLIDFFSCHEKKLACGAGEPPVQEQAIWPRGE
jgi:hypothetical protein